MHTLDFFLFHKVNTPFTAGWVFYSNINVAISNTTIIQMLVFEQYVVMCGSKNRHHKYMCFKRSDYALKYANHSRTNGQHDCGGGGIGPIKPLNKYKNPHFDCVQGSDRSSKNIRQMASCTIWILLIFSCYLCVPYSTKTTLNIVFRVI